MTIIVRYEAPPAVQDLGAAGVCRVGWSEIVGVWGSGPIVRVVLLGDWL